MQNSAIIRNKWFIQQVEGLEAAGKSQAEIAQRLDVMPQYLNAIIKGRRNASEKFVAKFCFEFNVNQNDLLRRMQSYERGVLPDDKTLEEVKHSYGDAVNIPLGAVPFWDLPVSAGKSVIDIVGKKTPDGYIKDLPGLDLAENILPVYGMSMEPEVSEGALVGVRKMSNYETLNTERIYLIITTEDRMIKRIEHDLNDPHILWCVSPNYPRFKIYKADIIDIQRVCFVFNPK